MYFGAHSRYLIYVYGRRKAQKEKEKIMVSAYKSHDNSCPTY